MRAGKLRHRIAIEEATEATANSGAVTKTWATFQSRWAKIVPLQGRELTFARATVATATHRVEMRYLDGLTTKMRVNFGGAYLNIGSALNLEMRNVEHHLICTEVV